MATDLAGRRQGAGAQGTQFLEYDRFIERQLGRARSQIKSVEVLTSLAILVTGALAYLMAGALLDHWFFAEGLSAGGRWIAFGGFALAALVYLSVALLVPMIPELLRMRWLARLSQVTGLPVLRRIHLYYAARTIERSQGTLKNSLVNFLDLRRSALPESVLLAVERQAASDLSRIEVEHAVNRDRLIRVLYLLLGVVAVTCVYTLLCPKSTLTAFGRVLFPGASIAPATRTQILEVEPGDGEVFAGERVRVTARVGGRVVPEELTLYYTTATRQVVRQAVPMRPVSRGSRQYAVELPHDRLEGVQESFRYFLRAGDATTPEYAIRVIVPPTAKVESVHYEYPSYTGLEPKTVGVGDIAGLEGTEVTVRARTNVEVSRAQLDFGGDAASDLLMEASERELSVRFRLELDESGNPLYESYRIDFQTLDGQRNPRPTLHTIKVRPDLPPEVSLVHPGRDVELPSNGVTALVVEASDPDFALGGVRLRLQESGSEQAELIPLGEPPLGRALRATYRLDLGSRGAEPGDVLEYWAEARDNKEPESNHAQTPVFRIRVTDPVTEEQRQEMAEQAEKEAQQRPQAPEQEQAEGDTAEQEDQATTEKSKDQQEQDTAEPTEATEPPEKKEASQDKSEEQLSPDGKDDAEALERIAERMKEKGQLPPPEQPQQEQATKPEQQGPKAGEQQSQEQDQGGQESSSGAQGQQEQGSRQEPREGSSGPSPNRDDRDGGPQQGDQSAPQPGDAGRDRQQSESKQSSGPADATPSDQSQAPGQVPQPAPGEKQAGGEGQQGEPMGTGAQKTEGTARDEQSRSEGSRPSDDPAGAESGEKKDSQGIEKSDTKPSPSEPGPNPNTAKRQTREDNPAGTAQPGKAGERQEPQKDDTEPSTDKGSAPTPAQQHATSGQADKNNPSPTSDFPPQPLPSESKDDSRSPPDSETTSDPPGNADPEREQKASRTKGGGSLRQFPGAGKEGEGQRGDGKGENQPGTNSAGQSGGAPSDEPGKEEDGTRPGSDSLSSTPRDQRGAGTKQPGGAESGKGPAPSQGEPKPGSTQQPPSGGGGGTNQPNSQTPQPQSGQQAPSPDADGSGQQDASNNQPPGGSAPNTGKQGGGQVSNAPPAGGAGGMPNPGAGQQGPADESSEAAPGSAPNPDYARKAANLVLDRLDDQLRRNRVDQDLLDELGWNQKQLEEFVNRMRGKLDQRDADSAKLRDVLDRLRQPVRASTRQAGEQQREVSDVVDRGRVQPPPEWRDRVSAYRKRISEYAPKPRKND